MRRKVAVLLYPRCILFEVALATELLAETFSVQFFTPDGLQHLGSNGFAVQAFGSYADLEQLDDVVCILIPGGDPGSIIPQSAATQCLQAASKRGAVIAGPHWQSGARQCGPASGCSRDTQLHT